MIKFTWHIAAGLLLLGGFAEAHADIGFVIWASYPQNPSINIPPDSHNSADVIPSLIETPVVCDDVDPPYELLDCPYEFSLNGVDLGNDPQVIGEIPTPFTDIQIYGGHEHDKSTHPFYDPRGGTTPIILVSGGTFQSTGPLSLQGHTRGGWVDVSFLAPEASGSVWTEIDIGSPPGWNCVGECFTFTDSLEHDSTFVGFFGLQKLPDSGTDYFVGRNSDSAHPEGDWGTPFAIGRLQKIAYQYHKFSGSLLSVNDMSLPEGGLFDWKANLTPPVDVWATPHRDHRTGNAFDINHLRDSNNNSIPCEQTYNVKIAIIEANYNITGAASLKTPIKLVCEDDGNIHVNAFDPSQPYQIHE